MLEAHKLLREMLSKKPDFKKIEAKWQKYWEKNKIYKFNPKSKKQIYSIDTPPVYASAAHLHVGHALHYTQFEFMARFWRMNGKEVYFPPCFDNNGMPTEHYVEEKFNIKRGDMSRAKFRKLCRKEAAKVEKEYAERAFKGLGHSHDWDLIYTTIDPEAQKIAQTSFLDLLDKGYAYRAEEPTLWCVHCQTALAQAEVENSPRDTKLNWIYFELEDGKKIEIATTRPEFLPATVAVFVHPKDKRYKKYVGKTAKVPLFDLKVPILTDETVDPKFGSGCLMTCDFGDREDVEKWKKHKLPLRIMLNKDGTLNELAKKYKGLNLDTAKGAILDDLIGRGYFIRDELLHQEVGLCWRCHKPVEYIITKQWFINILDFKKQVIKQARKINWYPKFMRKRLEDWTNNLGWNWCISRQRFYGVPIPVWYCKKCGGSVFAKKKDLPIDPTETKLKLKCKCGSTDLIPEDDVFDTWMTSSMTPQIAARWLEKPKLYRRLFPMGLRPQGFDILRTWCYYTLLKSLLHFKQIPWRDIMIGTYVLDPKGKGMHKSLGNAIWLPEMREKYCVDAIRYWAATGGIGEELLFKEKEIIRGQKLLIKLWNTARFTFMHPSAKSEPKLSIIDKWILSLLAETTKKYISYFEKYQISKARKEIEMFFLHDFCDFYIEMIKHRLYSKDKKQVYPAAWTLYNCFEAILKLWSPFIPHITEELYQTLFRKYTGDKSIHISKFEEMPKPDKESIKLGELACSAITAIRQWKQSKNMSLGAEVEKLTLGTPRIKELEKVKGEIAGTMRISELKLKKAKALAVA